ncbi:anti-sigma factor [Maricaulis sp. W15]|uniref:anti-sigma factor family protein n=1 Tax=Maricaulis sp. W15 TaxID=1772333 RepID=UPI000A81E3E4|nr:hypothetical protein [Maricaulis sp. W15]
MMIDDETLIAFLDGELDEAEMERIAVAIDADPALTDRLERLQLSDQAVRETYQPIAEEAVPDHLIAAVRQADRDTAPDSETVLPFQRPTGDRPSRPAWQAYGAIAASLVIGVLIGSRFGLTEPAPLHFEGDRLMAGGVLATALDRQASGAVGEGDTHVQLSFATDAGGYCRAFQQGGTAGLACREDGRWVVELTAPVPAGSNGPIRTASTALPTILLEAVDARIAGETLDAEAEAAAIENGWSGDPD